MNILNKNLLDLFLLVSATTTVYDMKPLKLLIS